MSSTPSDPADGPPTTAEVALILRVVGAVVLLAVAAGVAALCSRSDGSAARDRDLPASPSDAIGPVAGTPLATYASQREAALAAARGRRAAAVSFTRYRTEKDARQVLAGVDVRALLVATPGGPSAVVTGSLAEWAERERESATEERKSLEGMLDADDPSFVAQFRADIARIDAYLAHLDPGGEVVFGAVVRADAEMLRGLAKRPPVRLVDVGAGSRVPAAERTRGVRPEETVRAGTPPERPVR